MQLLMTIFTIIFKLLNTNIRTSRVTFPYFSCRWATSCTLCRKFHFLHSLKAKLRK